MTDHARVYIPVTPADLTALRDARSLPVPTGSRAAYAVTDAVRASDPGGETEGWEYAALQDAAAAAVAVGGPVVVVAADVDMADVDAGSTGSQVALSREVPLPRIASLHVGDDVLSASPVDPVHPESGVELSWYDTTELEQVIALL